MHFQNLEIGTSDFNTLIETMHGNGISVEPVPYYFNRLPNKPDWIKVNAAISNESGQVDAFYCDPKHLHHYPKWIRGCNSIIRMHPTLAEVCKPEHIVTESVEVITLPMLFIRYGVTSIGRCKIDTEGHDLVIVNALIDSGIPMPSKLQFESNVLSDRKHYRQTLSRLRAIYRQIHATSTDTFCASPRR